MFAGCEVVDMCGVVLQGTSFTLVSDLHLLVGLCLSQLHVIVRAVDHPNIWN